MSKRVPFDHEASYAQIEKNMAIYRFAGELYNIYMSAARPARHYTCWRDIEERGMMGRGFLAVGTALFKRLAAKDDATNVWRGEWEKLSNHSSKLLNELNDLKKKHEEALAIIALKNKECADQEVARVDLYMDARVAREEVVELQKKLSDTQLLLMQKDLKNDQLIDILDRYTDPV